VTKRASVPFLIELHQMLGREILQVICSGFLTPILFSAGTLPNIWSRDHLGERSEPGHGPRKLNVSCTRIDLVSRRQL
jgi:hypothetical protein